MKRTYLAAAALLLTVSVASSVFGQVGTGFTITSPDGLTIFTQGNSPTAVTGTSPTTDYRVAGAASSDNLFGNWWWWRVDGVDSRENSFHSQTGPTVVGANTALRNYTFPFGTVALSYTVTNGGNLTETAVITPLTAGNLNIFNYVDFFLSNQDANDIVDSATTSLIKARDTVTQFTLDFGAAPAATNFQAAPFNVIGAILTNTLVNDLNNVNTSTAAGDQTAAFQWVRAMQPGVAITLTETFVVPEPGTLALLGLGALALIRRR